MRFRLCLKNNEKGVVVFVRWLDPDPPEAVNGSAFLALLWSSRPSEASEVRECFEKED